MNASASYAEAASYAARHRCATCKGLLEAVVRQGEYLPFCPTGRGEHRDFEMLPSPEQRLAEHVEEVRKLAPGQATKEDIFGKDGY